MDAISDFLVKTSTPKILVVAGLLFLGTAILRKLRWIDLDVGGRRAAYASGALFITLGLVLERGLGAAPQPDRSPETPTVVASSPSPAIEPTTLPISTAIPSESSPFSEDFSRYQVGTYPPDWRNYGSTVETPTIAEFGGTGISFRALSFPSALGTTNDLIAIYDKRRCSQYTVQVKLNFQSNHDTGGLIFAWKDPENYMSLWINIYWKKFVLIQHKKGGEEFYIFGGENLLPVELQQNYILKVESANYRITSNQMSGYLTTDKGQTYKLFEFRGLDDVTGKLGVGTGGPNLPKVYFDDFSIVGRCEAI